MLLKVGELARRSGVTVRTLHHYDNLDLLKPSARSDAGYRLYDRKDIERLHHIQALRGLGLSLTDIGALLNQRAVSLPGLIDQQLLQLDRQLQSLQRLRSRLHRLRERYVLGEEPALTDLLDTLGSMIMYEKHFSADELARLAFTERLDQGTSAWPALAEQAKALMEAGVPPQAEQAQRLARDWMIQLERDTAQDPALLTRLDTMHAAEPGLQQRTGVSQAMRDYVLAAFAEYRLAIYRRHLTDDEFARMRTHYAASLRQWPELLAQLQRCRSERLPPEHELRADELELHVTSEEGAYATATLPGPFGEAKKPEQVPGQIADLLSQLGTTLYHAEEVEVDAPQAFFIPNSQLKALRREAIEALTEAREAIHPRGGRKPVSVPPPVYPESHLSFLYNVYNEKARTFYHRYGVQLIDAAYEAHEETGEVPVMITKHCLRFSFNLCPKQAKGVTGVRTKVAPMQLVHGDEVLTLKFDCKPCEMHVIGKMKGHILDLPQPGSASSVVGHITPDDLLKTIRHKPA